MSDLQSPISKRKKFLLVFTGGLFFLLVVFFYFSNIGQVLKSNSQAVSKDQFSWADIKDDFNETVTEINFNFKSARQASVRAAADPLLEKMVDNINISVSAKQQEEEINQTASSTLELLGDNLNLLQP